MSVPKLVVQTLAPRRSIALGGYGRLGELVTDVVVSESDSAMLLQVHKMVARSATRIPPRRRQLVPVIATCNIIAHGQIGINGTLALHLVVMGEGLGCVTLSRRC